MSSTYVHEPPTAGKVVLTTTFGEIEIELWSKECPKACRSFVQLCLERYYDNVIFHRIIPAFMIQTGDPTGSGTGGESAYGEGFADEVHSRLGFRHRGMVAMANSGKPCTNGSQFFILIGDRRASSLELLRRRLTPCVYRAPWLDKKHTIFGKVAGSTIYNALKIGEVEVEAGDRPAGDAPRIVRTEVVWNPFEDIVPRNMQPPEEVVAGGAEGRPAKRRNLALLSFGEEAEEEEAELAEQPRARCKSVHDVVTESDPRLARVGSGEEALAREAAEAERERLRVARLVREKLVPPAFERAEQADAGDFDAAMRARLSEKRRELGVPSLPPPPPLEQAAPPPAGRSKEEKAAAARSKDAERLRRLGISKALVPDSLLSADEVRRRAVKHRKLSTKDREAETLARLARFESKLASGTQQEAAANAPEREGAIGIARYAPQGLYYAEDEEDGDWRSHSFVVAAGQGGAGPNAFAPRVDDYEVVDPRREF